VSAIAKLQTKLNYFFKDQSLLQQALTHRSYGKVNNERLEFLGDSVLGYVIANYLYQQHPNLSEGELHKVKSNLVNQKTLAELAKNLDLGQCLYLDNNEDIQGGRDKASIISDSLEAIFAAISLDSNLIQAQQVIVELFCSQLERITNLVIKDHKTLLQEYLQEKKLSLPRYEIIETFGPDHASTFKIECFVEDLNLRMIGIATTKKEASQIAAQKILTLLKEKI
jgi:ribonuclease-3